MADVAEQVMAIIASKIPGGPKEIKLTDDLRQIGLESIDAIEMVFDIEEKFGIQVPYNANDGGAVFATVGDVVKAIEGLVEPQS